MSYSTFEMSITDNVVRIRLNRPPVNAVSDQMYEELRDVFQMLVTREDISVGVISAAGRGFSAGRDTNDKRPVSAEAREDSHHLSMSMFKALYEAPVAMVCAIHGFAVGAGLSIAAMADIRVASREAIFSMPEINIGISVGGGGSKIRRLGVPTGRFRELLMTGRNFSADEAMAMNLVDYVVERDQLESRVEALVAQLASKRPTSLRLMKQGINAAEHAVHWEEAYEATVPISIALALDAHQQQG